MDNRLSEDYHDATTTTDFLYSPMSAESNSDDNGYYGGRAETDYIQTYTSPVIESAQPLLPSSSSYAHTGFAANRNSSPFLFHEDQYLTSIENTDIALLSVLSDEFVKRVFGLQIFSGTQIMVGVLQCTCIHLCTFLDLYALRIYIHGERARELVSCLYIEQLGSLIIVVFII